MSRLTHLDETGRARMVDVSAKPATVREAKASGVVRMTAETLALALSGEGRKGNVLAVAELAGIMAAKRTADLIPLCHPLALSKVEVRIEPQSITDFLKWKNRLASHNGGVLPTGVDSLAEEGNLYLEPEEESPTASP